MLLRFLFATLFLALAACGGERISGPLSHEAYVWQRSWTPALRGSVTRAQDFSRLVVLAAEIDLRQTPPRIARVPFDASLRASGRPIGIALRIHTFPRRFADAPETVDLLTGLAENLLAEARAAGLPVAEVQLDYDCPESRLADYPVLIEAVRRAAAPVPVTITALPSWLRRERDFSDLISTVDGYVLQVHSLTPPAGPGSAPTLCDPRAAREAVEAAARFRQPFRVALPTYGYAVVFNDHGDVLGIAAEGPDLTAAQGGKLHVVRSDPAAMAGLVRGWTESRPAELAGVIWYRLPAAGDRLNWPEPALRAVMAGREPRRDLRAEARSPRPGLIEVDLVNRGEAEVRWPAGVRIRWSTAPMIAADGLNSYRLKDTGERETGLEWAGPEAFSRPGDRRTIAWLRFAFPLKEKIQIELPPDDAPSAL